MLEFREITLADREWMEPLLRANDLRGMEYSFTFNYIWRNVFGYQAARMGDYALIKAVRGKWPPAYLFPAGSGDIAPVLKALEEDAAREESLLVFFTLLEDHKALLETMYPGEYEFLEIFDYSDYVYEADKLITLAGKKLHSKRNHIHRFEESNPGWSYEPITGANLPEVVRMSIEWCILNGCGSDKTLNQEAAAVQEAASEFLSLGMDGGLIRVNGDVIAFSMGDRLNSDTYLVHIEKAFGHIQGAYAAINQQFAIHNCAGYRYVNREDDSGNEGLRKAKRSYRPAFQIAKYAAKKTGNRL